MWKANWEDTKQHFVDWWNHEGLVIGMWGAPPCEGVPHEQAPLEACAELGRGKYLVGCPDLVENMEILASLRDALPYKREDHVLNG